MKVLVVGSRGSRDSERVNRVLNSLHADYSFDSLLLPMSKGVATSAMVWANNNDIPVECEAPDWKTHGKSAGYKLSDALVALSPDLVIAVVDGPLSSNTEVNYVVDKAEKAGILVSVWEPQRQVVSVFI